VVIPRCRVCSSFDYVVPLDVGAMRPGVQYWSCRGCGSKWATRDMSVPAMPASQTCPNCRQEGRDHAVDAGWDHAFICAGCGVHWTLRAEYMPSA
jgi:transposase-like protein